MRRPKFKGQREERVGDARKVNPMPLRLRSVYVQRELGGAEGYRGRGWEKTRKKVLIRDKMRSTISGLDSIQGHGLQVDHINPYRLGGSNKGTNLRVTDYRNNTMADHMKGGGERQAKRRRAY